MQGTRHSLLSDPSVTDGIRGTGHVCFLNGLSVMDRTAAHAILGFIWPNVVRFVFLMDFIGSSGVRKQAV